LASRRLLVFLFPLFGHLDPHQEAVNIGSAYLTAPWHRRALAACLVATVGCIPFFLFSFLIL